MSGAQVMHSWIKNDSQVGGLTTPLSLFRTLKAQSTFSVKVNQKLYYMYYITLDSVLRILPGCKIKKIQKEICTQRKSATVAITPRADKTPETVEDEARLNTGDALAELLLSVVEPEPVLAPAPMAVGEEAATGETLAVTEWISAKIEGVAELMRVLVMPGR